MKIPRCKGASDMMPQNMQKFRRIKEVFRSCCASWGYDEIRTPVLEYLHLFTSAGTLSPEMLSRVYSFLDWDGWSGERVVLRPDGTIPAARLYVESMADRSPARLYYIENMFSFEGTGQESRERWQCGVELIGESAPQGDAELIMLALEVIEKLHVTPVSVKLSHVGLSKALLQELGIDVDEQAECLRQILSGDTSVLNKTPDQSQEVKQFLKLLRNLQGKSLGFLANLRSVLPESLSIIEPHMADLAQVAELLDSAGQDYQIDFTSGQGFEYYTGIAFQFYNQDRLLGTGGRYDELVPLVGGGDVPASGFALFTDKLMPFIGNESQPEVERIQLTGKSGQVENIRDSFEIAGLLRKQGYIVEMNSGSKSTANARWTVSVERKGEQILLSLSDTTSGKEQKGLSATEALQNLKESSCR